MRVSDSLHSKAFEWLHMRTVIRTGDIKAVKPPTLIKLITSIIDDMKLPLTSVSVMKGNSMSPTFNDGVKDGEGDKVKEGGSEQNWEGKRFCDLTEEGRGRCA